MKFLFICGNANEKSYFLCQMARLSKCFHILIDILKASVCKHKLALRIDRQIKPWFKNWPHAPTITDKNHVLVFNQILYVLNACIHIGMWGFSYVFSKLYHDYNCCWHKNVDIWNEWNTDLNQKTLVCELGQGFSKGQILATGRL